MSSTSSTQFNTIWHSLMITTLSLVCMLFATQAVHVVFQSPVQSSFLFFLEATRLWLVAKLLDFAWTATEPMKTGCMQLHDWLQPVLNWFLWRPVAPTQTTKISMHFKNPCFVHMNYPLDLCKTRGFEPFFSIFRIHIKKPCFVHFKYPLYMCKTRGCKSVCHQPIAMQLVI